MNRINELTRIETTLEDKIIDFEDEIEAKQRMIDDLQEDIDAIHDEIAECNERLAGVRATLGDLELAEMNRDYERSV